MIPFLDKYNFAYELTAAGPIDITFLYKLIGLPDNPLGGHEGCTSNNVEATRSHPQLPTIADKEEKVTNLDDK